MPVAQGHRIFVEKKIMSVRICLPLVFSIFCLHEDIFSFVLVEVILPRVIACPKFTFLFPLMELLLGFSRQKMKISGYFR